APSSGLPRSPHPAWRRRAPATRSTISTRAWSTISPSTASGSPGASVRSSVWKRSSPSTARIPPPSPACWCRARHRTRRARGAGNAARSEGALVERVEVGVDRLAVGVERSRALITRAEAGQRLGREVRARLAGYDQLAHPLSDQERAGDPEGVASRGYEQPVDGGHLADQVVSIGRESRQARAPPDDRRRLARGNGARAPGAKLLQDELIPLGLLDREGPRKLGHGEPLGRALEAADEHAAHFRTQIDGRVGHPDHGHLARDPVHGGGDPELMPD